LRLATLVQIDRGFQQAGSKVVLVFGDDGPVEKLILPIRDAVDRIPRAVREPRRPGSGKTLVFRSFLALGISAGQSSETPEKRGARYEDPDHVVSSLCCAYTQQKAQPNYNSR
jgi:hypothetical protein